jgi:hypothetical protein
MRRAIGLAAFDASRPERQPDGGAPTLRARVCETAALLSFCALAVSARALSGTLRIMEILAIRNSGGLVILLLLAVSDRAVLRVARRQRRWRAITRTRQGATLLGVHSRTAARLSRRC